MQQSHSHQSRRIVFIRNVDDIDRATDRKGTDHFLTSSMSVYSGLQSQGCEVSGTWDYITGEIRRQILVDSAKLKDDWYSELRDCLTYRGINMGEAIKFPVFHFLWEALASTSVADSILKLKSPSEISLAQISGIPARYGLAARSDVPEAIFAYYADRFGVPVRFVGKRTDLVKDNALGFLRRSLPGPVRKMGRSMLDRLNRKSGSPSAHEFHDLGQAISWLNEKKSKYTAIGASAYQSLLMVASTATHLEQTGEWSTLLLHTGDVLDLDSMLTDPRTSDFIIESGLSSLKYLEIYKTSKLNSKAHKKFTRNAWRRFKQWQAKYQGDYPQVFSNNKLEFQFRYLLTELMEELCRVVEAAYDVLQRAQPNVLLVGNVSEKDLTVAAVAQAMKVPSVLLPHNLWWASPEDYEYPVDYIAVQNEGTARFLEGIVGERQLLVAGDLKRKKSNLTGAGNLASEPSGEKTKTAILVLSGGYMPGAFQNCDQGAFYTSLQSLLRLADNRSDWQLVLRLHPRLESFHLVRNLVEATKGFADGRIILETSALAEDLIPQMDVVLMLDYRSSPAIAAWRQGIPVICWTSSPLLYSLNDMFQDDWFPLVKDSQGMEQMIDRFMTDDEWRHSWINRGYELTNNYFSAPELPEMAFADMLTEICDQHPVDVNRPRAVVRGI
jgi:hypothetical protein